MSDLVVIPLGESKTICSNPSPEILDLIKEKYKGCMLTLGGNVIHLPIPVGTATEAKEVVTTTNTWAPGTAVSVPTLVKSHDDLPALGLLTPVDTEAKPKQKRRTKAEMAAFRAGQAAPIPVPTAILANVEEPVPPMAEPTPPTPKVEEETEDEVSEMDQETANTDGKRENLFNV